MEYGDLMLNDNYPVGKVKSDRLAEIQVKREESCWPNSPTRYKQTDIFFPEGCDQGAQIRTLSRESQTPKWTGGWKILLEIILSYAELFSLDCEFPLTLAPPTYKCVTFMSGQLQISWIYSGKNAFNEVQIKIVEYGVKIALVTMRLTQERNSAQVYSENYTSLSF